MIRKILTTLGVVIVIAGIVIVLCASGSSDLGEFIFKAIVIRMLIGVGAIVVGCVGVTMFGDKEGEYIWE